MSSIFHRVLLTHDLAFSASQFVPKKKSPRIYTRVLVCTRGDSNSRNRPIYARLEDNLIRHRGDRVCVPLWHPEKYQPLIDECFRFPIMNGVVLVVCAQLKYRPRKIFPTECAIFFHYFVISLLPCSRVGRTVVYE